MQVKELRFAPDVYAANLSQGRTFSSRSRDVYFNWFTKEKHTMSLADKAKAKAAQLRAGKTNHKSVNGKSNGKPAAKKATAKASKGSKVKSENRVPRVQVKDGAGKLVTGRDNTFTCVEDKSHKITGPWSYKQHLVKVHGYSRKQAGLRAE